VHATYPQAPLYLYRSLESCHVCLVFTNSPFTTGPQPPVIPSAKTQQNASFAATAEQDCGCLEESRACQATMIAQAFDIGTGIYYEIWRRAIRQVMTANVQSDGKGADNVLEWDRDA
jgi:hypothetical protein